MYMTICHLHVTEADLDAFIAASLANATASRQEPGVVSFDLAQRGDDPTRFVLVEVYRDEEAIAAHKTTEHFLAWREAVADFMASPRETFTYEVK